MTTQRVRNSLLLSRSSAKLSRLSAPIQASGRCQKSRRASPTGPVLTTDGSPPRRQALPLGCGEVAEKRGAENGLRLARESQVALALTSKKDLLRPRFSSLDLVSLFVSILLATSPFCTLGWSLAYSLHLADLGETAGSYSACMFHVSAPLHTVPVTHLLARHGEDSGQPRRRTEAVLRLLCCTLEPLD